MNSKNFEAPAQDASSQSASFGARLRAGETLVGPFFTTPSSRLAEMVGGLGFDCVCVDAEHGPLGPAEVDGLVAGLRLSGCPAVVRVPANRAELIGGALDSGADAVMVPHIVTGEDARQAVAAASYRLAGNSGSRGFAGATRAAGFGARSMAAHIAAEDARRIVIGQVEDAGALDHLDAILEAGLDCLFIGRSDLTVSMGETDRSAPAVLEACEHVARRARAAGKVVGTFTTDLAELPRWRELGVSVFLLGSELGLLRAGAQAFRERVARSL